MELELNGALDEVLKVKERFESLFGDSSNSLLILSPASLILLGDHTHYNDGLLISSSINRYSVIQIKKRNDRIINLTSTDWNNSYVKSFALHEIPSVDETGYKTLTCLIKLLYREKYIHSGFDCVVSSNIPECIGLGVMAALETGFVSAIKKIFKLSVDIKDLFRLIQENELNLIGKISNKAHHYTIKFEKEGRLLFIDLRSMDHKVVSLSNNNFDIVVCDTQERIMNPQDICNERITECEVGVKGLRLYIWGIKNLRDVELDFLLRHFHMLPKKIFNRVLYNVKERIRTEKAIKFLKQKSLIDFGKCITESHWDLANDYELSSEKCDFLVETASTIRGVLGSKMISCSPIRSTLNIIEKSETDSFIELIKNNYRKKFNDDLITYKFSSKEGLKEFSSKKLQLEHI